MKKSTLISLISIMFIIIVQLIAGYTVTSEHYWTLLICGWAMWVLSCVYSGCKEKE